VGAGNNKDMQPRRLNYGCGNNYRDGWVNLDINRSVKADVYIVDGLKLPFGDSEFDEILLDNVLEHVPRTEFFPFMDELCSICRPEALIHIYSPHFTSIYGIGNPAHHVVFCVDAFSFFDPRGRSTGERYGAARFEVVQERLLFFGHNVIRMPWLAKLPINWLFNFGFVWKKLMERFQVFGFDEIYFKLKAVKE